MSSAPREAKVKLTRWQYFVKTLYHNASATSEFSYNKVIYTKSEELQAIEQKSQRINMILLFLLFAMFLLATRYEQIWMVVAYLVIVVAAQAYRVSLLPKDIKAHLHDTGRREF